MTQQGDEGRYLYMITTGEASVRVAGDGPSRELARLGPGDFFGEMSLLTGEKRAATVVAVSRVDCYLLEKSVFEQMLGKRPEVAEHIAEILARRRTELFAAKEDLDQDAKRERLRATKTDLLGKIRSFFGLEDDGGPPK